MSGSFSSNFLDALAHPTLVDPVGAIEKGNKAAQAVWQNRESQANQLSGQAYLDAVQPDGTLDVEKYRTNLQRMGPGAALAARQGLLSGQELGTAAQNQGIQGNEAIGKAIEVALNGDDAGLHARVAAGMQRLIDSGAIPRERGMTALAHLPNGAAQLRQYINQYRISLLPPELRQGQEIGTQQTIATPQATYVTNVPPIGANKTVVVPHGPTPGQTTQTSEPYDDQGLIPRDANGVPTRQPKGYTTVTKPITAVPDVPGGGPPQIVPGPGASGGPSAQPPIPAPPGTRLVLSGGRFQPAPAPAPTQAAPAPTQAAPAPQQPVTAPPPSAKPPAIAAPPQGQPAQAEANVKAYTADQADYPNVQTRAQNLGHAYDALNALKMATGRGAQGINDLRSWAQTLGILPSGAVNEQKLFEIVHKYTERAMIDAAGGSATDMGRHMAEQANAGTLLSTPANAEIIRNDMGKVLQSMAAFREHGDKSGAGYLETRAKVADITDPRGFVWNMYSPEEQAKINAEVKNDPAAADKLHKAIGMVQRLKLQIPGLSTPWQQARPARQKQSFAAPPQNALAMA